MSNKFNVLGSILSVNDHIIELNVRRNFRNMEQEYEYDKVILHLSLGVSPLLVNSLNPKDFIQVYGRVQNNESLNTVLIVEEITPIKELYQ